MNFNMKQMMQQAQAMQKKVMDAQEKLVELQVEGEAGGGMVKVTVNGRKEIKRISIAAELCDPQEKEMLEDLIVAASNNAYEKADAEASDMMAKVTGNLGLPGGFKLPF